MSACRAAGSLASARAMSASAAGVTSAAGLRSRIGGRVAVPILLWVMGVPFTLVFLLWLFFFRGH